MAAPSTDLQTLATNAGMTYEGEEMIGARNYWKWLANGVTEEAVQDFFYQAQSNNLIGKNQNGLSRLPGSPWCPDNRLRIPETNDR
jgi:hypothetical protein